MAAVNELLFFYAKVKFKLCGGGPRLKRMALFLLMVSIMTAVFIHDKAPAHIRPEGTMVTLHDLEQDMPLIIKKPMSVTGVELLKYGSKPCEYCNNEFRMKPYDGTALYVRGKVPKNTKDPDPVRALMQIWMYLEHHQQAEPIEAVYTEVRRTWIMDRSWVVGLSRDDFITGYDPYRHSQLTEEEIVYRLADQWIETNDYYGYWNRGEMEKGIRREAWLFLTKEEKGKVGDNVGDRRKGVIQKARWSEIPGKASNEATHGEVYRVTFPNRSGADPFIIYVEAEQYGFGVVYTEFGR